MNAARRLLLTNIVENLRTQVNALEEIGSDERLAFDNLPESLQAGDKGQEMEQAADALESAASILEDVCSEIEDVVNGE